MKNYIRNYFKKKREAEEAKRKAEFMRRLKMNPQERRDFDIGKAIARAQGLKV